MTIKTYSLEVLSRMTLALGVAATAVLLGCNSDAPAAKVPAAPAYQEPKAGAEDYSMLKAEGTRWVNQQDEKVSLRGLNLGNWLVIETWMFDAGDNPLGENINDQCSLEATLTERFGADEKERLMTLHREQWFKVRDWDLISQAGFNFIRLPFPFDLLEDTANPQTLKENAWHYLDWAIAEAKARNIYVLLDLHGAAGGQSNEHHTGCTNQNNLWDSEAYRARTAWLWQQIAERYKDEAAVAGYGLLNEPWGTDSQTLADFMVELYEAIREVDSQHIVVLPDHNADGISAYGDPLDLGMTNVAFEHHEYPGIFDGKPLGYQAHRDWMMCGAEGATGLCDLTQQARRVYTPMLLGETQTWTGLGELGGDITRASFDRYNALNWAVAGWSYKTTSNAGGLGNGQWGYVTNEGEQLLAKAETWSCDNWSSTFENACAAPSKATVPFRGDGEKTMYLVVKTGSFSGTDVIYDDIRLVNESTGEAINSGADFGAQNDWQELAIWFDERLYDYNYSAGEFAGSDSGAALRITAAAGHNSIIYQPVTVVGGQSYLLKGKFKDNGDTGSDMWAEVYLVDILPTEGVDVTGRVLPPVDMNSSSVEEIEAYFNYFGGDNFFHNEWVRAALTADSEALVFSQIPQAPNNLVVNAGSVNTLSWNSVADTITGYRVYRSTSPGSGFTLLSETQDATFTDESIEEGIVYFYQIASFNATDESYGSAVVASGETFYPVPGKLEAEAYADAHPGVRTEASGDNGGGKNIGWFEADRWVEYDVNVAQAGDYRVGFRLATVPGSDGFELYSDNTGPLATVVVPATGGWQTYQTIEVIVTLSAGKQRLRLLSLSNQWNLNWFEFTAVGE